MHVNCLPKREDTLGGERVNEERKEVEKEHALFNQLWQDQPGWMEDSLRAMEGIRVVNRMIRSSFSI